MKPSARVSPDTARRQIELILMAWGAAEDKSRMAAEVLVDADLKGIDSHGISMLLFYEPMHRRGQINFKAQPKIVRQSASTALIDGDAGLGHPCSVMAMKLAIEKALSADIGAVSVFNSQHFGAAGYYAEMAARQGLLAIVSCSTRLVAVVPTFGTEPVLGTNPFAFAAPAGRHPPLILDIATSVVASNKVKAYALQGKPLPKGWVVDSAGQAVTDSAEAYRLIFEKLIGGLAPIGGDAMTLGGHKGYGLSIFAQIFGSTLGGGSFSPIRNRTQKPSEPDNIGHFFLALNPAAFRPTDEFKADVDAIIDTLKQVKPADEAQPVLVPGDPERMSLEDRIANGIPMPEMLLQKIREIAAAAGAPFILGS